MQTNPVLQPNTIYHANDGRFLEYLGTSGKKPQEPAGFRFLDVSKLGATENAAVVVAPAELESLLGQPTFDGTPIH